MMLGESNQKSYNITLKNVVQTMIKIVIETTNDSGLIFTPRKVTSRSPNYARRTLSMRDLEMGINQ